MNIQKLIKNTCPENWHEILLDNSLSQDEINQALTKEYQTFEPDIKILPPPERIFHCFQACPYSQLKVIFLGQDPYINLKQNLVSGETESEANGMSFSVNTGLPLPPSLKNILKELQTDMGDNPNRSSDFNYLAEQGVLFLNSALTVRQFQSNSHAKIWKNYTDGVITRLSEKMPFLVFILLGKNAQSKKKFINVEKHGVIEEVHPSPLSAYRGFFGSQIFSRCNQILEDHSLEPIAW